MKKEIKGVSATQGNEKRIDTYEWIECILFALIVCVLLFVFFVRLVDVQGDSMYPTLIDKDKMVVTKLFYTPKQGDIIVFQKDSYAPKALVKRIIATEGQTVEIDFDRHIVYVDGEALDEPYIAEPTVNRLDFAEAQKVPEGCVFVMGDNRNESYDSRGERIGMVDTRSIIGKCYYIAYPFNHIHSPYGK